MCPVFQDLESFFEVFRTVGRDRQEIDRFVERSVGVQVGAETHAHSLEKAHQLVFWKIPGPVESHVFAKMCQALLFVRFQDTARIDHEAKFHLLLRPGIRQDIIGQPIIQFSG